MKIKNIIPLTAALLLAGGAAFTALSGSSALYLYLLLLIVIPGIAFLITFSKFNFSEIKLVLHQAMEKTDYNECEARMGLAFFRIFRRAVLFLLILGVMFGLATQFPVLWGSQLLVGNSLISLMSVLISLYIILFFCNPFTIALEDKISHNS